MQGRGFDSRSGNSDFPMRCRKKRKEKNALLFRHRGTEGKRTDEMEFNWPPLAQQPHGTHTLMRVYPQPHLQIKNGKQFFLQETLCCGLSRFSCVQLFETPWTVACQTPLSMEILQARIVEWIAMPSSRGSSQPRDGTLVSRTAGRLFTVWATRKVHVFDI